MKQLRKSRSDVKIFGVCSGIAEYFTVDPTLIRVLYLTITVFTGVIPGAVTYLLLGWIIPEGERG